MALRGRIGCVRQGWLGCWGGGRSSSAWAGGVLGWERAMLVGPQAQDAVLDRSRRAIRWHGEPHQLGAQPGGWLTEDDRAQHQLEQDLVEVRRHRAGTASADGRTGNPPAAVGRRGERGLEYPVSRPAAVQERDMVLDED